jgi:perosamine synthetase
VIGIEQMKKLQWRVDRKKEILKRYQDALKEVDQVYFFSQDLEHTTPWFIDSLVEDRTKLQAFLKENNIGTRVMYPPINKQKAYSVPGEHPVSNLVGEKGLWLPSAGQLTDEEIDYICAKIIAFYS